MSSSDARLVAGEAFPAFNVNLADGGIRKFREATLFCLHPEGTIQIAAISNGSSARPDLAELLDGMIFTIGHDKPARGTVT